MPALGRYTLVSRIGVGGMAEIWKAQTTGAAGFAKTFAIKRILPQFCDDPQFVQMFVSEAKVAQRLENANVVRVVDFGQADDGGYFLVMEYVGGRNVAMILERLQERDIALPLSVVVHIGVESAKGLGAAHRECDEIGRPLDLVHRDVSPQNILVSWQGDVKITDFGIAKAGNAPNVTRTGVRKGKLLYMSPEQAKGEPLDARSDLYSLGLVLYEMATGRRFLTGDSVSEISRRLIAKQDITDAELQPVPELLRGVITRALKGDREERFSSAAEMEAALLRVEPRGRVLPRELLAALLMSNFEDEHRAELTGATLEDAPPPQGAKQLAQPDPVIDRTQLSVPVTPKETATEALAPVDPIDRTLLSVPVIPREPREDSGTEKVAVVPKPEPVIDFSSTVLIPGRQPPSTAPKPEEPADDGSRTRLSAGPPPSQENLGANVISKTSVAVHRPPPLNEPSTGPAEPAPLSKTGFYKDELESSTSPNALAGRRRERDESPPPSNGKRILFWAGGALLFGAVFALGLSLGSTGNPTPTPAPRITASPSPTPARIGVLHVESDPAGADVLLDGKKIDVTPVTIPHLPVPHSFLLEVKKDGLETWSREVDVTSNERLDRTAKLAPKGVAGFLVITIPPDATASLDGHPVGGRGPSEEALAVQPGVHEIRFRSATGSLLRAGDVTVTSQKKAAFP